MRSHPLAFLLLAFSAGSLGFPCTPLPGPQPLSGIKYAPHRGAVVGRRCSAGPRGGSPRGPFVRARPLAAGPGLDFDTQAELLDAAYAGAGQDGFCTTHEEDAAIDAVAGAFASTYGEITASGLHALFSDLGVKEEESFYDLGSGVGRAVLQAHLRGVRRCVGIELARSRYRVAVKGVGFLAQEMEARGIPCSLIPPPLLSILDEPDGGPPGDCGGGVHLKRGDIKLADISDANVVYLSSLCFSEDFMGVLADKISSEARSLRILATLQRFPSGLDNFMLHVPVQEYEMSWSKARGGKSPVFVYEKIEN